MDYQLRGRGALITGAAGSIGLGMAEGFAKEGAKLFITDLSEPTLKKLSEGIVARGGMCGFMAGDVTSPSQVKSIVSAAAELFGGKLDVLVNAAGAVGQGKIEETPEAEWDSIFAVNCKGTFLFIREAVPIMKKNRYGRIINFSSKSGKTGSALMGPYSASKAAIIGLTQALAHELADHGIRVNCVCPGIVENTGIWGKVSTEYTKNLHMSEEEVTALFAGKVPLKRLARVKDVVSVVLFLASEGADYMTGQAVNITGGREMH